MAAYTFQFWADGFYQDYDRDQQQFLNSELLKVPRPTVVRMPLGRYEIRDFDAVESGNAAQVNLQTRFERHVLLKPVYNLRGIRAVLQTDGLRFEYFHNGWWEYPSDLQRKFRAAVQCVPRPSHLWFHIKDHDFSYRLEGIDTLDGTGCGEISQVNVTTGKQRRVRVSGAAVAADPAGCKFELGICRGGQIELLHPEAYRTLRDALRAGGDRPDHVVLPSGDTVENFSALEAGGAGIKCKEVWIPLQLCPSGGISCLPANGTLVLPDELENADPCIINYGEFCVLPESSQPDEKLCAICLDTLEPDDEGDTNMEDAVFKLRCGHLFHGPCLEEWFKSKPRCPQCQTNFGKLIGSGPRDGRMSWHMDRCQLPGHPESSGTIMLMFDFPAGVDESGTRYAGRREGGYLPANAQGFLLLELFKVALRRRSMFGIGNSMTTGQYRPTFNIHIKTSKHGGATRHGYPDPAYFQRALEELRGAGVSIADLLKD